MADVAAPGAVRECARPAGVDAAQWLSQQVQDGQPLVIRGAVAGLEAVARSQADPYALLDYLLPMARALETEAFEGPSDPQGTYAYGERPGGFNFDRRTVRFDAALAALRRGPGDGAGRSLYIGSLPIASYLPAWDRELALDFVPATASRRLWIGHPSRIPMHFDTLDNVACVVAGRRRFLLVPPDAIGGLYVGPVDHTMAGQPVSLASLAPAGDPRYPLFAQAMARAQVAELQPGDALFLPKLWWHEVTATSPLNAMVNHWWDATAAGPDSPYTALMLAMITLAERPLPERLAWRAFFDHYVFRPQGHPLAHLPESGHGILGPLKPENYGRIRAWVMRLLREA
jgi:hypothetical protein